MKWLLAALFPLFLLAGCPSQYGVQVPASATITESERALMNAYSQVTGARVTLNQMEARKRVTAAEKAAIVARLDALRVTLDQTVGVVNTAQGTSTVSLVLSALLVIESELAAKEQAK
jgi:hypothetical protein